MIRTKLKPASCSKSLQHKDSLGVSSASVGTNLEKAMERGSVVFLASVSMGDQEEKMPSTWFGLPRFERPNGCSMGAISAPRVIPKVEPGMCPKTHFPLESIVNHGAPPDVRVCGWVCSTECKAFNGQVPVALS